MWVKMGSSIWPTTGLEPLIEVDAGSLTERRPLITTGQASGCEKLQDPALGWRRHSLVPAELLGTGLGVRALREAETGRFSLLSTADATECHRQKS